MDNFNRRRFLEGTAGVAAGAVAHGDDAVDIHLERAARVLQGFAQEQALLRLSWRGVAPALLQVLDVDEQDLASAAARAAQWSALLPFFVLMAVVYGALHAALDTTAGERERGSLEPLLANPVPPLALVLGKWGAVAAVAMLSCPTSLMAESKRLFTAP